MTAADRQDPIYLAAFSHLLHDILSHEDLIDPDIHDIHRVVEKLQDAGWRMVTVKDWKEMVSAWVGERAR